LPPTLSAEAKQTKLAELLSKASVYAQFLGIFELLLTIVVDFIIVFGF
jgi:hypothetical protein